MDYLANFLIKAGKFKLGMNFNVLVVAKEIENSKKNKDLFSPPREGRLKNKNQNKPNKF